MIKDENGFVRELLRVNEWWDTGKSKKAERYPKRRSMFPNVQQEMKSRRIIILSGPRRVGKTVILHQLIQKAIDSGVNKDNIIYYQMDDPSILPYTDDPIKDIIEHAMSKSKGKTYVFLDEIQAQKEWYRWIKAYYDRELNIKFVLSGSSSLRIQTEANKYLRGRTVELELLPLDFGEFLQFSSIEIPEIKKKDARQLATSKEKIEHALMEYLTVGGFPEWFEIKREEYAKDRWLAHLISDVPKKAIYEDIAVYFGIRNPKTIDLLLNLLAENQSKILSYEKINEVVGLNRATLSDYIEFLKSSYLILEIPVYGTPKKQMKAMKKYLLIDQGLRNSLVKEYSLKEENKGFIIENVVGRMLALHDKGVSYWREQGYEVDYVVDDLAIEVKYKNSINNDDLKGLFRFLEKNKKKRGIVITKDILEEKKKDGMTVKLVPFWMFLIDPKIIRK